MANEIVTLTIPLEDAESIQHGMSDLLCWVRGYLAGTGPDASHDPFGQHEAQDLNRRLKNAIREAT